jgi:hypothetical protein
MKTAATYSNSIFKISGAIWLVSCLLLVSCGGGSSGGGVQAKYTLSISKSGNGKGTITSNPPGIDCGTDCSEVYLVGAVVTLKATADNTSTFSGWGGDADCTDGQVTMYGDKSCTAAFNLPQPGNQAPTANDQTITTPEDTAVTITLTGSDPENDPLTYIIVTNPAPGTLSGTPPNLVYTPQANFNGSDNFTFKVSDGSSDSAIATVSITVTPVNDPPVITGFTAMPASGPVPLAVTFAVTASDVDGTITSIRWDFENDGTVDQTTTPPTFSTNHTYSTMGTYTARVTVEDDQGATATATTTVTAAAFFGPKNDLTTGSFPRSVAMGDLNGDGKPDLVVANANSSTVSIFLGDGTGNFGPKTDMSTNTMPQSVAIGDLNKDGKPDLAVANLIGGSAGLSIFLGNGDGSFGAKTDFDVGLNPSAVVMGDLNNDGNLDLAVANDGYNTVTILLGNGKGSFVPTASFTTANSAQSSAIGDVNGDGNVDLIVSSEAGYVSVLLGNGNGSFGARTDFPAGAAGQGPESVAIADFNGDNKPDAAAGTWHAANINPSKNLSVLLGNGAGSFGPQTEYDTLPTTAGVGWSVAFGDVNGDGNPDLMVTGLRVVSVLLGDGTGNFGPRTEFATGEQPFSIAIGDLNGDGKPDLAVANSVSDSVSVLLNTTTAGSFASSPVLTVTKTSSGGTATGTVTSTPPGILCGADCTESYQTGAVVTLVAVPDEDSVVKGWSGDCAGSGSSVTVVLNVSKTCTALFGPSPVKFGPRTDFNAQGGNGMALGDIDGDGNLDFLAIAKKRISNVDYASLTVAKGSGSGTFTINFGPFASNPSGINYLHGPVIGDLNGDGKPDLVVVREDADVSTTHRYVSVLLGDGAGGFSPRADVPAYSVGNAFPHDGAIGDFNRDGKLDLAVSNFDYTGSFSIFLGDGSGGFTSRQEIATLSYPGPIAVGDLNNDGKLDIVVGRTDLDGQYIAVHLGDGAGGFASPVYYLAAWYGSLSYSITSVAIGDLNGDGKPDIVAVNWANKVTGVLLGDGTGSFGPATFVQAGFLPWAVAIGDVSGDGKPDLVVANEGDDSVSVLLGDGTGAFPIKITKSVYKGYPPVHPRFVAIGDLNKDGKPDVLVGDLSNPSHVYGDVSIFINTTANLPFTAAPVLNVSKAGAGSGTVISTPIVGIACGTDCTEVYQAGTAITLVAKPDQGSTFDGWSGNCAGTDISTTVVMNGNRACIASFK